MSEYKLKAIKEIPEEIKTVYVQAIILPNGEVMCNGKVIGTYREYDKYLYSVDKIKE